MAFSRQYPRLEAEDFNGTDSAGAEMNPENEFELLDRSLLPANFEDLMEYHRLLLILGYSKPRSLTWDEAWSLTNAESTGVSEITDVHELAERREMASGLRDMGWLKDDDVDESKIKLTEEGWGVFQ